VRLRAEVSQIQVRLPVPKGGPDVVRRVETDH